MKTHVSGAIASFQPRKKGHLRMGTTGRYFLVCLRSVWVELDKPTFNVYLRWTEVQYCVRARECIQANHAEDQQMRELQLPL